MEIIKVENVSYRYKSYDSKPVDALKNVSFSVNEGEFLALVGANGSGKSTLAKHLNGLLLPRSGNVFVFGHNTKDDKDIYEIRKNVGVVFQNPDNQIVATIVEDDVAFGPENLGIEPKEIRKRVDDALKSVNMYELRHREPHKLSGGQKQRISIARVFLKNPPVLLLDEATSALDNESERLVQQSLERLAEGRTTLTIAHRLTTVRNADEIVVLTEDGVAEKGTHDELMKKGGVYSKMYGMYSTI